MNPRPIVDRPEIKTDRLVLRRPAPADTAAIISIAGDWQVASRLARVPYPYGEDDARFFLEQLVPYQWVWAITVAGANDLVGVVGLSPDVADDSAELGYWLSPMLWGQGIATEAAHAVVAHGFDALGLQLLTSAYFADNPASGRVLEKLGFVVTGTTMAPSLANQSEMASVRMQLLRSAWG
jgi:RimJ/RimL family protein N-acetyltransferase